MTTEKSKTTEKVRVATISVVDSAKDQFTKAAESQLKTADEVAAFGKSNVEAFIQAGSIFFHGFEELTRSFVGIAQSQVETGMSAAKAMIGAKTLTELTDMQNSFTKTAFDAAVSEATHISELGDQNRQRGDRADQRPRHRDDGAHLQAELRSLSAASFGSSNARSQRPGVLRCTASLAKIVFPC